MENGRSEAAFIYRVMELLASGNYKAVNKLYTDRFRTNVQKAKELPERVEAFLSLLPSTERHPTKRELRPYR